MLIILCLSRNCKLNIASHKSEREENIMKILAFLLLAVAIKCDDNVKFEGLSRIIQPAVDERTQEMAAMDVIKRLIPDNADNVAIKVNFQLSPNQFKVNLNINE